MLNAGSREGEDHGGGTGQQDAGAEGPLQQWSISTAFEIGDDSVHDAGGNGPLLRAGARDEGVARDDVECAGNAFPVLD